MYSGVVYAPQINNAVEKSSALMYSEVAITAHQQDVMNSVVITFHPVIITQILLSSAIYMRGSALPAYTA